MISAEQEFADVREMLDERDISWLIFYRNELEVVETGVRMLEMGFDWIMVPFMHPATRQNILQIAATKDECLRKERIDRLAAYRALLDKYAATRVN